MEDVSQILASVVNGDQNAADELLPMVYTELRRLAESRMAKANPGNTLQPTALVHEAYMRLIGSVDPGWNGRRHFFGAAAQAMRDILVEQARRKARIKHGGDRKRVDVDTAELEGGPRPEDVIAVHEALELFEKEDPRCAEIVRLRYFAGLSEKDIASGLDLSERTIRREWRYARSWLQRALSESSQAKPGGDHSNHGSN